MAPKGVSDASHSFKSDSRLRRSCVARPEHWFAQADEADLTRTLVSARDLARDLGVPLILRDTAGFIRGFVDADGGYRMV